MEAAVDAGFPPTPVERCPLAPPPLPAALPEPTVLSIMLEGTNECVVLRDGTARCVGQNHLGQLGSGVYDERGATPRPVVGLGDARQIFSSLSASRLSLQADGTLRAWGRASLLGAPAPDVCGSSRCALSPQPVPGIDRVVSVATSHNGVCVLRDDRTVWCWGLNVGLTPSESPVPVLADDRRDVIDIFSGRWFIALRRADGTLIGRAASEGFGTSIPPDWTIASGNAAHLCATLPDLTVRCWGHNTHGQIGADRAGDPAIREGLRDPDIDCVRAVSRGLQHTCAVRTDGTVWCWGNNNNGESGAPAEQADECPDSTGRYCVRQPRRVEGVDHVDSIVVSDHRTCAIRTDRTVWCWGASFESSMGSPVPVRNDWR